MMSDLFSHLGQSALWAGALGMAVLAIRRPVAGRYGPHAAYALWALPVLRLVLPVVPLPAGWTAALVTPRDMPPPPPVPGIAVDIQAPIGVQDGVPVPAALPQTGSSLPDFGTVAPFVWLVGSLLMLIVFTAAHIRFARDIGRRSASAPAGLQALSDRIAAQKGLSRRPAVHLSRGGDGPLVHGLLRPQIVLPSDFEGRFTEAEQRLALAHELTHVRRGDLLLAAAMTVFRATQWWNPLGSRMVEAFRADQEASCDAAVLAGRDEARTDYLKTLLKAAVPQAPMTPALTLDHGIKERITMLRTPKTYKSGLALAGSAIALGLCCTASYALQAPVPVPAPAPVAAPSPPAPAHGDGLNIDSEDGILLLTNPMAGLEAEFDMITDIDVGDFEMDFDIEPIEVEAAEIRTTDGRVIALDGQRVILPPSEAKLAEIRARAEEVAARFQGSREAEMAGFTGKLQENTGAIARIVEECRAHQAQTEDPAVFAASGRDDVPQKVLCFTGGSEALTSIALRRFVERTPDLTDADRDRFAELRDGHRYSFHFDHDADVDVDVDADQ